MKLYYTAELIFLEDRCNSLCRLTIPNSIIYLKLQRVMFLSTNSVSFCLRITAILLIREEFFFYQTELRTEMRLFFPRIDVGFYFAGVPFLRKSPTEHFDVLSNEKLCYRLQLRFLISFRVPN